MKKHLGFKSPQDIRIRYLFKVEKSKFRINSKKGFLILSSFFCLMFILFSVYWYVTLSSIPQLNDGLAIAQDAKLSYQIQTYNSQVMGGKRTYGVCLPLGYDQTPPQRYPVVFLLHGGHGDPTDWFEKGLAIPVIEQLYATNKLPPSIIITPDGNDLRGSSPFFDPQYIDGPNGKVNTAIGDELVKIVQSRYNTLPTPNFWAIGGLSSGGWGALNVGLHHLNNFSILFSHSGYFRERYGTENSPILYIKSVPKMARSRLHIYLDAGEQDGMFLEQTQQFSQVLRRLKISYVVYEFPGGHNLIGTDSLWNYWHKHLADSLTYVGNYFRVASSANATRGSQPAIQNTPLLNNLRYP